MVKLTQDELKRQLHYDQNTGIFTRLVSNNRTVKIGEIAGNINKTNGYHQIRVNKIKYQAHRLAWMYIYGKFPDNLIDHINGIRHDNRINNLREANNSQNCMNKKLIKTNTTGYAGVSFHKRSKKYRAKICVNGLETNLGDYETPEEAHLVREKWAKEYFGQFYRKVNLWVVT